MKKGVQWKYQYKTTAAKYYAFFWFKYFLAFNKVINFRKLDQQLVSFPENEVCALINITLDSKTCIDVVKIKRIYKGGGNYFILKVETEESNFK